MRSGAGDPGPRTSRMLLGMEGAGAAGRTLTELRGLAPRPSVFLDMAVDTEPLEDVLDALECEWRWWWMLRMLETLELVDLRPRRPEDRRRVLRGVSGAGLSDCRLYFELDTRGGMWPADRPPALPLPIPLLPLPPPPPVIELAMGSAGFGPPMLTRPADSAAVGFGLALPAVYFPVAGLTLSASAAAPSFPALPFFLRSGVLCEPLR